MPTTITLLTKPGCHLCDVAREVVVTVVSAVSAERGDAASTPSIVIEEQSILDDAGLLSQYGEEIPVVMIDGRVHTIWRVDAARLRAALTEG